MGFPLTWQLSNDTPLRRWFERRLGAADGVPGIPRGRVRCLVTRRRPDPLPPWLIGMAFDWRLRIGIELPADSSETTAHVGWEIVRGTLGPGGTSADAPLAAEWKPAVPSPVTALFVEAAHARGDHDGVRDEMRLAKIAVALARYENCYRGGVRRDDPLVSLGPDPSLGALLALCPDAAADEIVRLTAAARRGLAPLFPADSMELNPDFSGHGTPADGDLIIDGLLLDLKTVTRPEIKPEWLWQVLGYVFLDEGRRGIDRVGLYLSRHAWLGTWDVNELLSALAGTSVTEGQLRDEFLSALG